MLLHAPDLTKKHHSVVITDDGDDPRWSSSEEVEGLLARTIPFVIQAQRGYCYLFIDGKICFLSDLKQAFTLTLPGGEVKTCPIEESSSSPDNGRFDLLPPVDG